MSMPVAVDLKPLFRGWIHTVMVPLSLACGIVLVALTEGGRARAATAVYAVSALSMFGTSALYHRGSWSGRTAAVLRRLDHSTIYLFIAGSYTPFAVLTLGGATRVAVLAVAWSGALLGVAFRTIWLGAPRWLLTSLYVVLGWTLVWVLPQFIDGARVAAFVLVCVGGGLYTLGAAVYGLKRPNFSPRVFGFHEFFHALVVAAFIVQYIAISLVAYRA
jgi:hemolysin III